MTVASIPQAPSPALISGAVVPQAPIASVALPATQTATQPPPAAPAPNQPTSPVTSAITVPGAAGQPAAALTVSPSATVAAQAVPVVTEEPQAASPLLVAQIAARPPATVADLPKSPPQPAVAGQQGPPPMPATPQAALAQMLPEALAKQNSLGPLLSSLATMVAKQGALPEPVLRAAMEVLAQRIAMPANGPTADMLKAAIAKSGIYLEAGLSTATPPSGDLKAGLTALKGALATWLGGTPAPVAPGKQTPPPLKGMPLRGEIVETAPLPVSPREAGRVLHGQADSALSRVKLMQLASLPDVAPQRAAAAEQRIELPFLIGNELVMAQFQVSRDGGRQKSEAKRGWSMRFAMSFSGTGEVGAEVGILGKSVNVALWAVEPETAERLNAALPELGKALAALGLDPGGVRVRSAPPEMPKPGSGHLLDSLT
ncbi:MAG: flagellar hook-length control protein FliK [Devosia sp.]